MQGSTKLLTAIGVCTASALVGCSANLGPGLAEYNRLCADGRQDRVQSLSGPYDLMYVALNQPAIEPTTRRGEGAADTLVAPPVQSAWKAAHQVWSADAPQHVPRSQSNGPYRPLFPGSVISDPVLRKILDGVYRSAALGIEPRTVRISSSEMEHCVKTLTAGLGLSSDSRVDLTEEDRRTPYYQIARFYLQAYFLSDAGFVTREGTALKRTVVKNGSVKNEHITPVIEIVFEAFWDTVLPTPVWYSDEPSGARKYETSSGKRPTVSVFAEERLKLNIDVKLQPDGTTDAVTTTELKAIRYLSGLAGDQGKMITGALMRLLGDVELSFVVGGHFSFGDNETFASVLDAMSEVALRRVTEMGATCLFNRLNTLGDSSPVYDDGPEAAAVTLLEELSS